MFFLPLICFAQTNDTIFFRNGTVKVVYKIDVQYNGRLYYTPAKGSEQLNVRLSLIDRIAYDTQRQLKPTLENFEQTDTVETLSLNPEIRKALEFKPLVVTPIQYNLHRFYKQKRLGHVMMGASFLSGVVYGLNPLDNVVFGYIAGGLGIIALVIDLDSYKWIKRASLETNTNSIILKVKF